MKDRLAQFLKSEGLTAVKFAEIMEVQPSSISHLLSGRNRPNFEFISRMLLRFPELNPDWIINGSDEIHRSKINTTPDVITDVTRRYVTDVIEASGEADMDLFTPKTKEVNIDKAIDYSQISPVECEVTDVNSPILPSDEPEAIAPKNQSTKRIDRVILFYADGSFEEYHN